jgi:hypothetical protein
VPARPLPRSHKPHPPANRQPMINKALIAAKERAPEPRLD